MKPAGRRQNAETLALIGFGSEEDWFEYRLEHHPEFLRRIEEARVALRAGQGIPLREVG